MTKEVDVGVKRLVIFSIHAGSTCMLDCVSTGCDQVDWRTIY